MDWIKYTDILPEDFAKKPRVIIAEYGNGQGKTHSMIEYAVQAQKMRLFDRIYFATFSQKGVENVCNRIEKMGGFCIRHIGIENFCPMLSAKKDLLSLGLPPNYMCSVCPYFKHKHHSAFTIFREEIEKKSSGVLEPKIYRKHLTSSTGVCIQPIIRRFVFDPTFESNKRIRLKVPPIIVLPIQSFFIHSVLKRWEKYRKRQRKERRTLFIIDEADVAFYHGLRISVPEVHISEKDREILEMFSSKTRKLERLIDIYERLYGLIENIYNRGIRIGSQDISDFRRIQKESSVLLKSFDRKRTKIAQYIIENKIKTNIFKITSVLNEIQFVSNPELLLKTIDKSDNGYELTDYDFAVFFMFSTDFPWKYSWKILLSASLPTEQIVFSDFVSPESKKLFLQAIRRTRKYKNVYMSSFTIFDTALGPINRNEEIQFHVDRIIECLDRSIRKYEELTGEKPRGITVWVGNSKQLEKLHAILSKFVRRIKRGKKYFIFRYKGIPIFVSFIGSSISRGLDFDKYDISCGIGPFLRPPRPNGILDIIDYSRAVAEVVQGLMRIVRKPMPDRPKLVILETRLTSYFYARFYPEWFVETFRDGYIEI